MNDERNMTRDKTDYLRLDERNHVEKPLLNQLAGLDWEIIDLDSKQHPGDTHRQSFTEGLMLPVLRAQFKVIAWWPANNHTELEACA